jgi:hypothetical protein
VLIIGVYLFAKIIDNSMGQKVPLAIKEKVINDWLQAKPRNKIADSLAISAGSVTNIINEVKRDSIKDIDLLRAVAVLLKKNNLDLTHLALAIRLKNKLTDLQIDEELADTFIEKVAIYCFQEEVDPYEFFSQIRHVCFICEFYDIPRHELAGFIENAKEKGNPNKGTIK